ncbi:MAG: hypothetical protein LBQ12_13505, partial [Deltaproteobacteria bacterium]|nr:hypothetical protein [Deltaproteobacteria bacterium]
MKNTHLKTIYSDRPGLEELMGLCRGVTVLNAAPGGPVARLFIDPAPGAERDGSQVLVPQGVAEIVGDRGWGLSVVPVNLVPGGLRPAWAFLNGRAPAKQGRLYGGRNFLGSVGAGEWYSFAEQQGSSDREVADLCRDPDGPNRAVTGFLLGCMENGARVSCQLWTEKGRVAALLTNGGPRLEAAEEDCPALRPLRERLSIRRAPARLRTAEGRLVVSFKPAGNAPPEPPLDLPTEALSSFRVLEGPIVANTMLLMRVVGRPGMLVRKSLLPALLWTEGTRLRMAGARTLASDIGARLPRSRRSEGANWSRTLTYDANEVWNKTAAEAEVKVKAKVKGSDGHGIHAGSASGPGNGTHCEDASGPGNGTHCEDASGPGNGTHCE